ncbi:caspase family protein [Sorangium sp. So ce1000]|uniref:caspase family protein n=1 Tax=Sorangium sp. So ce1000 TaxID=3133325 RepID=UPI003F5E723C
MLHAIVVGIDHYVDPFVPRLRCAAEDARALARLIEERVDRSERKVRLLLDTDATKRNIMAAIGDDLHRDIERGDIVVLYFACHGSPERRAARDRQSRYLIPHDAEYGRIHTTGIDMERDVAVWLDRLSDAELVVLFLDACFSGAAGGRTFMGPALASTPSLPQYLDDPKPISIKKLHLGRGRVVLCAADDNQLAREDAGVGHGVFTHELLQALKRPRGDRSTVGLTELYDEVEQGVRRVTAGAQEPVISILSGRRASLPCLG